MKIAPVELSGTKRVETVWRAGGEPWREVTHLHDLERAGESEWTPWIAIAGLLLFFVTIGLVMYGIVEGAAGLLAGAA